MRLSLESTSILYNLKEFAFEDQSISRLDFPAGSRVVAVTQLTWNVDADFASYICLGESTGESLDYTSHGKACRFLSFYGTVKDGAIDQGAVVVQSHRVVHSGIRTCSFF